MLLPVCVVVVLPMTSSYAANGRMFTIGYVSTEEVDNNHELQGLAITFAIESFQANGWLQEHDIKIVWKKGGCNNPVGTAAIMELHEIHKVDVIIGPMCSQVCIAMGFYLSYYNVPFLPIACMNADLDNKEYYPTLVRTMASVAKVRWAFLSMFRQYHWTRAVMITRYGDARMCELGATAIHDDFLKKGIEVPEWIKVPTSSLIDYAIDGYLKKLREAGRIIIICLRPPDLRRVMFRAQEMGMTGGDYVYLYYNLEPTDETRRPWEDETEMTSEQRSSRIDAFRPMKQVTMFNMDPQKLRSFYDLVKEKLLDPPWKLNVYNITTWQENVFVLVAHDTTYMYLTILNESLAQGKGPPDGRTFTKLAIAQSFDGMSGHVQYDSNFDRVTDYWMWGIAEYGEQFEVIADVSDSDTVELPVTPREAMHWTTSDGQPPPDTPTCGFTNELCPPPEEDTTNVTIIAGAGGLLAFACIMVTVAAILHYKKRKREEKLLAMPWKIKYDDVVFRARDKVHGMSMFLKSVRSVGQMDNTSAFSGGDNPFQVATYRDVAVMVEGIEAASLVLARRDLVDISLRREMVHENITTFIGAAIDPPDMCVLTSYCSKGTLQGILLNEEIKLDWVFTNSIILDIVKGMRYIHRSGLKTHGSLNSTTCLVDSRWTVKVSFFGLHSLIGFVTADCAEDDRKYLQLLWTAPELLRMRDKAPPSGTEKGDVYSFGIMLQEILFRNSPFFDSDISAEDIVKRVKAAESPPYRPDIPDNDLSMEELGVVDLTKRCWDESPDTRPSFDDVLKALQKMNGGRQVNIMDNMVQKLEAYATNLEVLVQQRTGELVEEKKKTDCLLYRMLPRSVAEKLKTGKLIEPEVYESVTIYFSDIVGFTKLSSSSTPMQVVSLLNDLYTVFDDTIQKYDVYKVETIGDAYMLVSGLPHRNGNRHAAEVANTALNLLEEVARFKIKHKPDHTLQLRIGIHTGSCAAGVVGLTMPRYCLFGDAVNSASRMESTGQPTKIHISEQAEHALSPFTCYDITLRGDVDVKVKGVQKTFWLHGRN